MVDALSFLKDAIINAENKAPKYAKPTKREIYGKLLEKPRLHILYGIRGSGKTTLLFQVFTETPKESRVYFAGDEIELLELSLLDVFKNLKYAINSSNGTVFLDEITSIPKWEEELKVIYDNYPEIRIYVSGSSAIELAESKDELARRAKYHHILPMSFREYMQIVHGINLKKFNLFTEDIYTETLRYDIYFKEIVKKNPIEYVYDYMEKSQPFMLEADEEMLMDLMNKIIYNDIAKSYSFDKEILNKFHRMILILSMSEKTSYENISKDIMVSKGIVGEMIRALINSGIIKAVLPYGSGKVVGRKTWRYFFLVPAIRKAYMKKGGAEEQLITGLTREDTFVSHLEEVFYLPNGPDFIYKNMVFEVGGKSKGFEQLENLNMKKRKFVVYDGLEVVKKEDNLKLPFYIFLSHI